MNNDTDAFMAGYLNKQAGAFDLKTDGGRRNALIMMGLLGGGGLGAAIGGDVAGGKGALTGLGIGAAAGAGGGYVAHKASTDTMDAMQADLQKRLNQVAEQSSEKAVNRALDTTENRVKGYGTSLVDKIKSEASLLPDTIKEIPGTVFDNLLSKVSS